MGHPNHLASCQSPAGVPADCFGYKLLEMLVDCPIEGFEASVDWIGGLCSLCSVAFVPRNHVWTDCMLCIWAFPFPQAASKHEIFLLYWLETSESRKLFVQACDSQCRPLVPAGLVEAPTCFVGQGCDLNWFKWYVIEYQSQFVFIMKRYICLWIERQIQYILD